MSRDDPRHHDHHHHQHQRHRRHRPQDLFHLQQQDDREHENGDDESAEGRHWTSLNCRFNHTLILMNCKSRAEAFARHLQTKLKSLGSRSSVDDDAAAVADGGNGCNDGGNGNDESSSSVSQTAVNALSKLSLSSGDSTSAPVMTGDSHLIDNRLDGRVHLNSSLGEDELYFDFGYSSPESPVTDVHDVHDSHVEDTSALKSWEPQLEYQNNHSHGLLVTEQPHSSSTSNGGLRCVVPYAELPLAAAVDGESGCMSAVSSVLTDADDIYASELDDGDEAEAEADLASVMLMLNEDYDTAVLGWPAAGCGVNGCGPSSADRLTPISEQLTSEDDVETVLEDSLDMGVLLEVVLNETEGEDVVGAGEEEKEEEEDVVGCREEDKNDDDDSTIMDHGTGTDTSTVPLIMTSAHSCDISSSSSSICTSSIDSQNAHPEQMLNDTSKLHVNVGLQMPTTSPDDVEADLLSPTPSDDSFPRRVQRSSSLKTGKTPPGTPNRKKIVRFADAMGLDLEAVKTVFLDDLPTVPLSAYDDLNESVLLSNTNVSANHVAGLSTTPESCFGWPRVLLMPLFEQPGATADFLDRVRRQSVCLESAVAIAGLQLVLVVRVLNLDYHKSVTIRYTLNDWLTYDDVPTDYVHGSCDGFSDKFHVTLNANHVTSQQRLLFAVRYSTGPSADAQRVFWDNNGGRNYAFQCAVEPDCHLLSTSTPSSVPDESWIHFL